MFRLILGILSVIVAFLPVIPYAIGIYKGKYIPALSTRIMFFALLVLALVQQLDFQQGYSLLLAVGEVLAATVLLILAFRYGVGGKTKIDIICYILLILSLVIWLASSNGALGLIFTLTADFVAFFPTIHSTWYRPYNESRYWYASGVIAPVLSILSLHTINAELLIFPLYICLVNLFELLLIHLRSQKIKKPTSSYTDTK